MQSWNLREISTPGGSRSPVVLRSDEAARALVISLDPGPTADQWLAAYEKLLSGLPPGVYELIVHLAYDDDEMRGATWDHPNWGAAWRQSDLDLVKSAAFQEFLKQQQFKLMTWRELGKAGKSMVAKQIR